MILQTLEMGIIRYDIIRTAHNCTIHKLIVIHVLLYQVKTEIRIFSDDIS